MAQRDDERLIRRIRRTGSERSKELLVRAYYDEIFVYAFRQTRDREVALDVAQETFIAAIRGLGRYDAGKASFRTWLYRIAANKVIDHRRGEGARREILLPTTVEAETEIAFEELVDNSRTAERAERVLSGYPAAAQEVFRLRVYGEYGFAEIARMTDRPEASVKTTYYRMVARIRKELERGEDQ